jgi:hypothetical protein
MEVNMLQYRIKRGKLVSLSYRVQDTIYDLDHLKSTPAWDMIGSLILAGNVNAANQLYKLAFSIAASKNWIRMKSGHWNVQYGGHILYVRSTDTVEVFLTHTNEASRVPKDLAVKAAEIAYYIRRRWYEQRVAQTAKRDTRRAYRSYRAR